MGQLCHNALTRFARIQFETRVSMKEILEDISALDRMYGRLCYEAESSYENRYYFAGIACLFVIAEQISKHSVGKADGNFQRVNNEAEASGAITKDEHQVLEDIREIRNRIFHENHYALGVVFDDVIYPFDEDETKEMIFEKFSEDIYAMVFRLLSN